MPNHARYLARLSENARAAAAEGCVLLKNDNHALPLESGTRTAIFGVAQLHYYASGLGSGGLVNTRGIPTLYDALSEEGALIPDEQVRGAYLAWEKEHPFSSGDGWSRHPWSQGEMPVDDALVRGASARCGAAIVILGRTAGEDKDNANVPGSYLLTDEEEAMLRCVCRHFPRTAVLLNTGNIIDMSWVERVGASAVMYVWQGGEEGARGAADVVIGRRSPSGRLADTIAKSADDYPSLADFGDEKRLIYTEDIYVGYRYFETFAPELVLYPFGAGLSYTDFRHEALGVSWDGEEALVRTGVTNVGSRPAAEVVQVYVSAPASALGKPVRVLCGFVRTQELQPGERAEMLVRVLADALASYDDDGRSGFRSCFVMEKGEYRFFAGHDVRQAQAAGSFWLEKTSVVRRASEACAPHTAFDRMCPGAQGRPALEAAPLASCPVNGKRAQTLPAPIPQTGDRGILLRDVAEGRAELSDFVGQLSDEDLCCIVRGEGMSSPRVTPGTAGAIGGVSDRLSALGIPAVCCADGPSGIRMDCGNVAFFLPCGTAQACTWDRALIRSLYEQEALDLRKNRVDMLLGPGMNIHRTPLGGRNFEYFSEDPLLTGCMAAAQLQGLHTGEVTGVIKHFACNNQEHARRSAEAVVSERALREIYLRGYEIAVAQGGAWAIMTSYNPINGVWAASSHDLLTRILRGEWGFDGVVMTDWWAFGSNDDLNPSPRYVASMIRAQNDLFMVMNTPSANSGQDDSAQSLASGLVTRAEYQRSAMNILRAVMKTPAFRLHCGCVTELDRELEKCRSKEGNVILHVQEIPVDEEASVPGECFDLTAGKTTLFQAKLAKRGVFSIAVRYRAAQGLPDTAQASLSLTLEGRVLGTGTVSGAERDWKTMTFETAEIRRRLIFYLRTFTATGGVEIDRMDIRRIRALE